LVVFGSAAASIPVVGGTLLVAPPYFAQQAITLGGISGSVGDGFAQISVVIPNDPGLIGLPIFVQAAIADPGAPRGWAITSGLEIRAQ